MASPRIAQRTTYDDQTKNQRDIITQSVISVGFGLAAFLAFCVGALKIHCVFLQ